MFKIFKPFLFAIFCLITFYSEGTEIKRLEKLEDILAHVEKGTWVIFDLDDVLIAPHASWLWHRDFLKDQMNLTDEEIDSLEIKAYLQTLRFPIKYQLVDNKIREILSSIQKKEGTTIALTARSYIEKELQRFFHENDIQFNSFISSDKKHNDQGILCSNGRDKGECLFSSIFYIPQSVIFIDDKEENCRSVLAACMARHVPCIAYHYQEANALFKWEVAEWQYAYWKKNGVLISDQEARCIQTQLTFDPTKVPCLLKSLLSLFPHTHLDANQSDLWEVHQEWIKTILSFLQDHPNAAIVSPEDKLHPIYHFDRQEAHEILKPICKNVAQFELTDEIINRCFSEQIPTYKDDHKSTPIEFYKTDRVKNEIFRIAKKTQELIQGNILILLGQTPAYVGEMIKTIDTTLCGESTIIQVPFSGRPNYTRKIKYKRLWPSAFLDIMTPNGHRRFLSLLQQKGISPQILQSQPKKIFIIDNSSGASVTCFLTLLKDWFEEEGLELPDITFLEMCDQSNFTIMNDKGRWIPHEKPDLCFNDDIKFDIPVLFLGMEEEILKGFDKVYDNLRIVPAFNSIHWSKSYLEELIKLYPTAQAKELIKEYQDYVIEKLGLPNGKIGKDLIDE